MAWDDIAAAATGAVVDAFAQSARYFPLDGAQETISVVFEREAVAFETDEGSLIRYDARAYAKSADIPDAQEGDEIEIGATMYQFATVEHDGDGLTELRLKKV